MVERDEKKIKLPNEMELLRQKVEEIERCEVERRRAEETFLDLFNATEEVALLMDREGIILVANKNAARLYGIPMEELPKIDL